jgi:hypothetical protein
MPLNFKFPLVNLTFENGGESGLPEGISLQPIGPDEVQPRLLGNGDIALVPPAEAARTAWALCMTGPPMPVESEEKQKALASKLGEQTLLALRLSLDGWVAIPFVRVEDATGGQATFEVPLVPHQPLPRAVGAATLGQIGCSRLGEFFSEILPILGKVEVGQPKIALARFNATFGRDREEDVIVDSMICIEAILLGDATTELSHRLSSRGALLLADSPGQRILAAQLLKRGYDTRSHIVHGSDRIGGRAITAAQSQALARGVLRSFLPLMAHCEQVQVLQYMDEYLIARPSDVALLDFVGSRVGSHHPLVT